MDIYLQGLLMGLAYVAPIGMQNLFMINTTLEQSRKRAVMTAWIVIFFDITLSLGCFLGVGALFRIFPWSKIIILPVGGMMILFMGYHLIKKDENEGTGVAGEQSFKKVIVTAFVVSWCNPQAILDGTMLLGAFRVTLPKEQATLFLFGVMSASIIWFLSLTGILSCLKNKIYDTVLRKINILCGMILCFYGCRLLWEFVQNIKKYDIL